MADDWSMARQEVVRTAQVEGDVACLREGAQVLAQALMEREVPQHVGGNGMRRPPSGGDTATATAKGKGRHARGDPSASS